MHSRLEQLFERIENKSASVGVIGLGYVGLPIVSGFHKAGFRTVGFDVDENKVRKLSAGESYILTIQAPRVKEMRESNRFEATSDFSRLREVDAIIICVPTPLDKHLQPDMKYIESTLENIARMLRAGQLIVLESTTYPGTTREVALPALEKTGLKAGKDFALAFSPERENPGDADHPLGTIPKVVGGVDAISGDLAEKLYANVVSKVVRVSTSDVAEASKILENIYRCVNIALVNELKILFDEMGIDVFEVIDAAKTKPFGFQAFYPGPGLGGHCIPIDPFYLTWKAKQYELPTRFIELAGEVNRGMPRYVISRLTSALSDHGKALKGAKVLVYGVAYKKDVDDLRESPALKLIELLIDRGADVSYSDPFIPRMPRTREYHFDMSSEDVTKESLKSKDAVIICTDHTKADYKLMVENAPLVLDTRGATRSLGPRDNVVTA
ncbi:MAG: nucleotide sugar dehydrogenase [Planctomycetes bacterium]|nr:nucleotide sugar dehydrogenase [Planctomycetota bacterium]